MVFADNLGFREDAEDLEDDAADNGLRRLPRCSPILGFLRHAPRAPVTPAPLHEQLDRLLRRRWQRRAEDEEEVEDAGLAETTEGVDDQRGVGKAKAQALAGRRAGSYSRVVPVLPRASPYVGFARHAPPSPTLNFAVGALLQDLPLLPSPSAPSSGSSAGAAANCAPGTTPDSVGAESAAIIAGCKGSILPPAIASLPDELWLQILHGAVALGCIGPLTLALPGLAPLLREPSVWRNHVVRVPPQAVPRFMRVADAWLGSWRFASRLELPLAAATSLADAAALHAPGVPVEAAWCFDAHLRGAGVEVGRGGTTVSRIADEELVVLGDAPLPRRGPSRAAFVEVVLDVRRAIAVADENPEEDADVNDFGLGITSADPSSIGELGMVADEVPSSWVVDFTDTSVVLSVDNAEAAKGERTTSADLLEGDRVGLRITSDVIEIFINGCRRERFLLPEQCRIPEDADIYPVFDLYGRTQQLSRCPHCQEESL